MKFFLVKERATQACDVYAHDPRRLPLINDLRAFICENRPLRGGLAVGAGKHLAAYMRGIFFIIHFNFMLFKIFSYGQT